MTGVKIYIVDDHPLVREGLRSKIDRQSGLSVCGESGDANEAFLEISQQQPDIALIDLALCESSGLYLIHRIHARFPDIKMLAISMYEESIYGSRAQRAGAVGYINKREISDQVIEAIKKVVSGKTFFNMDATRTTNSLANLSNRESQVFELISQGMTMSDIADQLNVSAKTVETHRENIKSKLNLGSSHELTVYASRMTGLQ